MNDPTHPVAAASTAYRDDTYGWAMAHHRNPGPKSSLDAMRDEAYRQARVEAQAETGLPIETFPLEPLGWNVINDPLATEDDLPVR